MQGNQPKGQETMQTKGNTRQGLLSPALVNARHDPYATDAAYLEENFPEMETEGMSAALQIFLGVMDDD